MMVKTQTMAGCSMRIMSIQKKIIEDGYVSADLKDLMISGEQGKIREPKAGSVNQGKRAYEAEISELKQRCI